MGAEHLTTQSVVSSVPPLPAPTETDVTTTSDLSGTDAVTDVSKPGDEKSSVSLPEDGTPITLRTGHRHQKSQTSLLIEYFEGGKSGTTASGDSRRPSVRVRLTPSSKSRRSSDSRERDRIQITETKSRKSSGSRRANKSPPPIITHGDRVEAMSGVSASRLDDTDSYASATEESNVSRNPIDIEINRGSRSRRARRPASPLIPTEDGIKMPSYEATTNMSDISAIPTDSFLDGSGPGHSRSPSNAYEIAGAAGVAAAAVAAEKIQSKSRTRDKERDRVSVSRTREKDRDRERSGHRSSKSRTTSISKDDKATIHDARSSRSRRASRSQVADSLASGVDSSVVSSIDPSHRLAEQQSIRSGTSKASSINNPKLLETVEDAIRRLILPELNALKREHSKHRDRMGSVTSSATSDSRELYAGDRRRSSGKENIMMPKDVNARAKVERRDREARNDFDCTPTNSGLSQESVDEEDRLRGHERLLAAAAGGAGLGAAAALAAHAHEAPQSPTEDKRTRRRRRAEMRGRNSDHSMISSEGFDDGGQDKSQLLDVPNLRPAMPLMSDVNASDVTRASIMSAESDRPQSASEELSPMHNITRDGAPSGGSMDSSPTPSKGPSLQALGAQHANISHGDLRALPRQRMEDVEKENEAFDDGQTAPNVQEYEEEGYDDMDRNSPSYDEPAAYDYYRTSSQIVPPPLKYVPYQPERRGLSPIPSVSGYTDNGSEVARDPRHNSQASPEQSPIRQRSVHSPNSIPSNVMGREFEEDDYMRSPSSVGPDYGRGTVVTEGSEIDPITAGRSVRDVGANPAYVYPVGIESNVASLVESSMLTDSAVGSSGLGSQPYNINKPTMPSVQEERSRSVESPSRRSTGGDSPASRRFAEYEIDEYGRKVPRASNEYQESPTTSELAITSAAVGAAAAVLRAQGQGKVHFPTIEDDVEMADAGFAEPAGVQRHKSFKERTQNGQRPRFDPKHSVDRLDDDEYDHQGVELGYSGMPNPSSPMPEIGAWNEDDMQTNPSMVDEDMESWRGDATPRDGAQTPRAEQQASKGHRGVDVVDAVGAAAIATAAALADAHSHNQQQQQQHDDDYYRTSDDRKRDTLVTNPYEGSSPVANLPGLEGNLMGTTGYADGAAFAQDMKPYPSRSPLGHKVDEGYISQGPNKSPEQVHATVNKGKGVDFNLQNTSNPPVVQDAYFTPKHTRHLSTGQSHGMGSPLYDSSTGAGIDQIESKDIVALMQHLMVRDAQRSARDTEILVTLVRSAAEWRNNFEDMKRMLAETIAETEDVIINEVKDNTEKSVQRAINGPRPYPGSGARSIHAGTITGSSQAGTINGEDALAQKKRNIFRRALKGLTAKGTNDLGRIEDMLNQLLSEVDVLKTQTAPGTVPLTGMVPGSSIGNPDNRSLLDNLNQSEVLQYEQSEDHGYEPEGHAGTSTTTASHASQSGHLSIQSKAASARQADRRLTSGHRISTVPEATEEEHELYEHDAAANPMTPTAQTHQRSGSVPLATPPLLNASASAQRHQGSLSNDNTPGSGSNSNKKKSWFAIPKISRWSETTTSSVAQVFRRSGQSRRTDEGESGGGVEFQGEGSAPPSRAGSIGSYSDNFQFSNPNPDQVFRADKSLPELNEPHHQGYDIARPHSQTFQPSPQIQAAYYDRQMSPEDPKYKAHRNSLNLQHPQPKHGPTDRFRTALESQALLGYDSPRSNRSADWAGSVTSLNRFAQHNAQRESYGSATQEYQQQQQQQQQWDPASPTSSRMPPIPPKEPLADKHDHRMGGGQLAQESVESGYGTMTQLGGQNASYMAGGAESSLASGGNSNVPGSPRQGQQLENRNLSAVLSTGGVSRRPSGPRPMTPKSPLSVASVSSAGGGGRVSTNEERQERQERHERRKRDTFGSVVSQESDTF